MKTTFISKLMTLIVITSLVLATSCQNEETVTPDYGGKAKVEPLTDQKIISEIQAMASGRPAIQGRTAIAPPVTLPPGYDYSNMQTVTISGTSWVTHVAYSTTVNTAVDKEMVAIYYQDGVYKNFMLQKWSARNVLGRGTIYYNRLKVPENWCGSKPFTNVAIVEPKFNRVVGINRIYPPSACGQSVANCVDQFYKGQGWLSVGLTLGSIVLPEILVGAIGGCMLGCALNGPIAYVEC